MNLVLVKPELKDYWYEEKLLSDKKTMSYNAGYNVSYSGYHYNSGCIDFNENDYKEKYQKRKNKDIFFAYILDKDINKYIGTIDYSKKDNKYECGILIEYKYRSKGYSKPALKLLIEEARKNNVDKLYDSFEVNRENTLKLFESLGFEVVNKTTWKKFDRVVEGVEVCKKLKGVKNGKI